MVIDRDVFPTTTDEAVGLLQELMPEVEWPKNTMMWVLTSGNDNPRLLGLRANWKIGHGYPVRAQLDFRAMTRHHGVVAR